MDYGELTMRKIYTTILLLGLSASWMRAQITIGGSVYGGGNAGDLNGKTSVTILAGDIKNVFGGARQANVGGAATVNIDGAHISGDILINKVYGGNDISGTIGTSTTLPTELDHATANSIDNSYNAFVVSTPERQVTTGEGDAKTTSQPYGIFIGQLFGGGNGDYDYTSAKLGDGETDNPYYNKQAPELAKTYLELRGGTIAFVYGGGNNATVTEATDICIDNDRLVTTAMPAGATGTDNKLLNVSRLQEMGIPMPEGTILRDTYHYLRVFGGNNKAVMAIQPRWHLMEGHIENLYSGGNEGDMTYKDGLLLEIPESSNIMVDNVYGGCRKADVDPGQTVPVKTVTSGGTTYTFPAELAARVLLCGGDINNVYGGNDISGSVAGGNAVGVHTSIRGSIYGGGNGSYPYTDNPKLKGTLLYGDYYYDRGGKSSVEALNDFRPNAEQVAIHVAGTDAKPTVIGGSIYCGGNSATLKRMRSGSNTVKLHIGAHVIADNVFLGNNGENMVKSATSTDILQVLASTDKTGDGSPFSSMDLTNAGQFAAYMQGCSMGMIPTITFDSDVNYNTWLGSFYLGGNVGSMTYAGTNTMDFSVPIYIYNKVVGGCNNANVAATDYNAAYEGGITVAPAAGSKKLVLNFHGTKLKPMRWSDDTKTALIWNTRKWQTYEDNAAELVDVTDGDGTADDDKRLDGGNVYGGCYESGYVNGDVEINIQSDLVDKDLAFGKATGASGVNRDKQVNDVMGTTLNVFGAGYGEQSEIRGNTAINITGGYVFQTFGGGEQGKVTGNCTTTIRGGEVEYIYGGGLEGPVEGSVYTHLGTGTMTGVIGGACNANIGGHTEVYIGDIGFPTIREDVYGGNDFGGELAEAGSHDLSDKVSEFAADKVYKANALRASAYVEYIKGNIAGSIFGGNYGSYDYTAQLYRKYTTAEGTVKTGFSKPHLKNAFVNFKPDNTSTNAVTSVYGGSQGYHNEAYNNKMQNRSYVLVDIPNATNNNFVTTQVFGAGDYAGVGLSTDRAAALANEEGVAAAAVIDLVRGHIKAAYGGSYREGTTRRTIVNVPVGSTINIENIFAGAYGVRNDVPCDVYEATLNYSSGDATVTGALYGGNNDYRRTLYGTVNVNSPVWSNKSAGYTATVYGAGYGKNSWSRNTTVNLNEGAVVKEVYGGGLGGMVLNGQSMEGWKAQDATLHSELDGDYTYEHLEEHYAKENPLGKKTNTNVYINKGATVVEYCYGGGLGEDAVVSGTTYIGLHGGTVKKDLYAGGTRGGVEDKFGVKTFVAESNAYIEGGTVRNVYGGGWAGAVGHHDGDIDDDTTGDIDGRTYVVIGIRKDQATLPADYGFYKGVPAVQRNAYAGGEGGAVFGTANITLNNGYIGYVYNPTATDDPATTIDERYEEKLHDETWTDHVGLNRLEGSGNVFGGGYVDNSSVDYSNVTMWGGYVRNSLFGGGEIAAVGRGKVTVGGYKNSERTYEGTYKQGKTHVEMYNGHVKRDVFGGGKGYDNLGRVGTLYTDGYVFGQTEVYIRGGEVGTETNYVNGYGNVFGGGDIGYVYGIGTADTEGDKPSPNHYYYKDGDGKWTEDCKVVVEPYAQVKSASGVTIDGTSYAQYDYVPTDTLNKLKGRNQDATWNSLDDKGIVIRNAVFGGGNVDEGSDKIYANTVTVFGNVTATLRDVYRRDLITIGTEHVGGLYGGGNLSLVNGYRELHVANYGTDYYGLQQQIDMDTYENQLTDRERAYFRLRYTCLKEFPDGKDDEGISYKGHKVGDQIWEDEYIDLPDEFKKVLPEGESNDGTYYWSLDGVCSIYAGRLLNTLQRADLAGVYGSRMVLQGARDRVTDVVDYTRYTINRIGELSLMKMDSPAGESDDTNKTHGNYFGIYSLVNYLGNMTSDVLMDDVRTSDTSDTDGTTSYWKWKSNNPNSRKRNTATSRNQVALASGVFLELTTENSTAEKKDYGYITGVVELDLINAKADAVGGGYVYAKNEHGKRDTVNYTNVTLSEYNSTARTYKMYKYSEDESELEGIQTSGNFVHGQKKTIIDDCYPHNLEYNPRTDNYSEAHYWYIKGSIYIYDQVLSAYTGSPTAYTRERHIPLTITAGSHGQLKLVNVQPNLYAYYDPNGGQIGEDGIKVNNNSVTYKLNDVITYWDWSQLPENERSLFVKETMVTVDSCYYLRAVGDTVRLAERTVMLPEEYATLRASLPTKTIDGVANVPYVHNESTDLDEAADRVFRMSNNLSHNTGYVISFEMDTPPDWDKWYSPKTGSGAISTATYNGKTDKDNYIPGPTFTTSAGGVYGQRHYTEDEIIPNEVVSKYHNPNDGKQAVVSRAYVTKEQVTYDYQGTPKSVNPGTAISKTEYDALDAATKAKFKEAYVCTNTLKFNDENYILYGDLVNDDMISELATAFDKTVPEVKTYLSAAYICERAGMYGGTSYASGTNYDALDGWASLTTADRQKNQFSFNYDAFDILADPDYTGDMTKYQAPYCEVKPVEYVAIYHGDSDTPLTYNDGTGDKTLNKGDQLSREQYEQLSNEKYHYTPIRVSTTAADGDDYYIAKEAFSRGNVPYAKGQVISTGTYRALTEQERSDWVEVLHFTNTGTDEVTYFYCREDYTGTVSVTNVMGSGGSGTAVKAGWVITQSDYASLPNQQRDFTIKGKEPTEKTTLYVSRESDINDLSSEKVISVIYQYTYNEGSDDGDNVELVNELHIINIHLQFESGAPIVDPLQAPSVVLPGSTVGLNQPNVTPGAYELLGGGWEIFDNYTDAQHHRNGNEYSNNRTPMYWYHNQKYYVAYYAKSYLGKTYSNPVPFTVANYHDLADVMADKEHHMYVDYDPQKLLRDSKLYINDYTADGQNGLDLLKDFIDLSHGHGPAGHAALNSNATGGDNLDFILRTNLTVPSGSATWTPLASGTGECFAGTFHGDGYTISGLDRSLFGNLCGDVYNLGVTGSFTQAGIANTGSGYIENCWVSTTATSGFDADTQAVFGNPTRGSGIQLVNCYYPESNTYSTASNARGNATPMADKAFYNGTVAYNLNGFYLNKRYYDQNVPAGTATEYSYLRAAADGSLPAAELASEAYSTGRYPAEPDAKYGNVGYVEDRYGNEDFIYAGGTIPENSDVRQRSVDTEGIISFEYAPIWPDDYVFFGQTLTYGFDPVHAHQPEPSPIVKSGGRLLLTDASNRVYRAPAYFQSKLMDIAHFNPSANLAATSSDGSREVYPGMTAIDFTGHNDLAYTLGTPATTPASVASGVQAFYPPLLDNNGLIGIANRNLTKNLLIYVAEDGATGADAMTRDVVIDMCSDPDYANYYDAASGYRRVAKNEAAVNSHIVERTAAGANSYQSIYDHFLVDKQDFNAPISYTFANGKRMWYQRTPDRYVSLTKGWETVSLPFTAELVSTQDKGELTHFYSGSSSVDANGTKIGHEYWLRDYKGKKSDTGDTFTAVFNYPDATGDTKTVNNTFLWDYYYSKNSQQDINTDTYQTYYSESRQYTHYPLMAAATPYIVGFPGKTYYEFDLSGEFSALHTAPEAPVQLAQQVITFAAAPAAEGSPLTIAVSDDELLPASKDRYSFVPNYMSVAIDGYLLNDDGNQFDRTATPTASVPFRPYFVAGSPSSPAPSFKGAQTILFDSGDDSSFAIGDDRNPSEGDVSGGLEFAARRHTISVTSSLRYETDVLIVNVGGLTIASFNIKPGETVDTDIPVSGVYIVSAASGRYQKKLAVK